MPIRHRNHNPDKMNIPLHQSSYQSVIAICPRATTTISSHLLPHIKFTHTHRHHIQKENATWSNPFIRQSFLKNLLRIWSSSLIVPQDLIDQKIKSHEVQNYPVAEAFKNCSTEVNTHTHTHTQKKSAFRRSDYIQRITQHIKNVQ